MKRIALLFMPAMMLASCSIYHPQAVDIPLIGERGDVRVDAAVSASTYVVLPDAVNVNVTASYGVTDWLSAQVHANYGGDNWYVQAAPGYYTSLGGKAVAEVYVGVGYGGSDYESKVDTAVNPKYSYDGHYTLPFAQFNIGWHNLGIFDIALGLKAGAFVPDFHYHDYMSDGTEDLSHYLHYTRPNFLFEPQLKLGIGGDHVKFALKVGYAFMDELNASSVRFYHDNFTLAAGLTFDF